ncbi:hypothetical protein [Pectobacterium versatile]|uniref:hypothetical protein n=1 Tax=Pectobacterium versatile TaxID=2488639 RepID=UPI001CF3CD62|nr:hypothetical protein [Pectobacterium versatile]MCA6928671.1 hypothetical protein [Pectobacterium versatile]MCH5085415.1 hypothetical protein [Pectobacterium versatile]
MSELAARYLSLLINAKSEDEFEKNAKIILEDIDTRIKFGNLSERKATDLIDELIRELEKRGYEKRDVISLEEHAGLEDFYKSLSIDNSKSDELLAMAMQSAPKNGAPKNGR